MRSLIWWEKSETNFEPQPSFTVDHREMIARFLTSKNHFAKSTGRIKYGSYLPALDGETSVFRVSGINRQEISYIGEKYVRNPRVKKGGSCTIYGWSKVKAGVILKTKLVIEPEPTPHPRHANLTNWLDTKIERQQQATDIANKATFYSQN